MGFFVELRRRNVYRASIIYGMVAWLLIQVATQVFPFFEIPNWVVRLIVVLLVIGFPVALGLAWAFEITPEGIVRTDEVPSEKTIRWKSGRKVGSVIIAILAIAIAVSCFFSASRPPSRPGSTRPIFQKKASLFCPSKTTAPTRKTRFRQWHPGRFADQPCENQGTSP